MMLRRRGAQAGLPGLYAHQLRHTFAHAWLAQGGTETDLMRIAGWRCHAPAVRGFRGRCSRLGSPPAAVARRSAMRRRPRPCPWDAMREVGPVLVADGG
jgi:hypothetical protein